MKPSSFFNIFFLASFLLIFHRLAHCSEIALTNPKKDWINFFERIKKLTGVNTFVETGTYLGDTTAQAAICFPQVHTIELNEELYKLAVVRFRDDANVTVHHGDSAKIFPALLSQLANQQSRPLFWLDGHYMSCMENSGDFVESVSDNEFTPIWLELMAIKNNLFTSIILIDDVRLFGTLLYDKRLELAGNKHYPLLLDVCTLLTSIGYSYVLIGDILFAYDTSVELSFSPIVHACTVSRLFNGNNFSLEEIFSAETLIGQAQGNDLLSLQELYRDFSMYWHKSANSRGWINKSPHYNLWYGLILKKNGDHHKAIEQFQEVIHLGYTHWRVYWYLAECLYAVNSFAECQKAVNMVLAENADFEPANKLLKNLQIRMRADNMMNSYNSDR